MIGDVKRIEQELSRLEQKIAAIAQEISSLYAEYLQALGQAVQQQLIIASYHLCTEKYPERFLQLSLHQRQTLQQDLKKVAQNLQEQLSTSLTISTGNSRAEVGEMQSLSLSLRAADDAVQNITFDPPSPEANGETAETTSIAAEEPIVPERLSPKHLVAWQTQLEEAITEQLRLASRQANRLLHQFGILQRQLPESILEAAEKAEATAEGLSGSPNLLKVLIEAESADESESKAVAELVAINLRLADIEFSNTVLTSWRNKLRQTESQLQSLGREYYRKQKEQAIANAQAAWRAIWFND